MQELEKRIGLLRILLADMRNKQTKLSEMENQYRSQLASVVEFVVYREGDIGNALSLMAEVQAKLNEVLSSSSHLEMIAVRANTELEVLLLTKRVAEARSQLAELEERQQTLTARLTQQLSGPEPAGESLSASENEHQVEDIRAIYDEIEREIARLHKLITEASERAARTIQPRTRVKVQPGS
jgi:CHASE3 domain sensor protein